MKKNLKDRVIVDITAMAEWLGVDEETLLDKFLQTESGKVSRSAEPIDAWKEVLTARLKSADPINHHGMDDFICAAPHFVRTIGDIQYQKITGTNFP